MSQRTVLLTSFTTWKVHQRSNSSDDLLLELLKTPVSPSMHVFRHLPVNVPVAKEIAISKIQQLQPQIVLCCGMAEARPKLSMESRAIMGNRVLHTTVNLKALIAGLDWTEISEDAGRFVCNGLYYAILNHLQSNYPDTHCVFVHVPILTANNRESIVADFSLILERVLTIH